MKVPKKMNRYCKHCQKHTEHTLNMVHKGSGYIGLISHRCGQIPECATRNPHGYSVTRLEFEEAQSLERPPLVFIMGDDHPVKKQDVVRRPGTS